MVRKNYASICIITHKVVTDHENKFNVSLLFLNIFLEEIFDLDFAKYSTAMGLWQACRFVPKMDHEINKTVGKKHKIV